MKLKFRVWDGNTFWMDNDRFWIQDGKAFHNPGGDYEPYLSEIENGVIQQFTGLLDKNGKEIFEGDILSDVLDEKYEVLFGSYFIENEVGHGIHLAKNGDRNPFPKMICNLDREYIIVGNVFQNPDLLK